MRLAARRTWTALAAPLLVAVAALAGACIGNDPYRPGHALGTFRVDAHKQADTCLDPAAPDPWTFDVQLARDPAVLYWIQGDVPVQGPLDPALHAHLATTTQATLRLPDAGVPRCDVARDDTLDATLTAAPEDAGVTAFTGTLTYAYRTASGSDCSGLAPSDLPVAALPCAVTYALSATRVRAP